MTILLLAFGRPVLALLAGALFWGGSSAGPPVLQFDDPPPAKDEIWVQEDLRARRGELELPAIEAPKPAAPKSDPTP
jgi:hypothetical protein